MWVSRTEWDALVSRVRALEGQRVQAEGAPFHSCALWGDGTPMSPGGITPAKACQALAKHLGVTFQYNGPQPAQVSVSLVPSDEPSKNGARKR